MEHIPLIVPNITIIMLTRIVHIYALQQVCNKWAYVVLCKVHIPDAIRNE